MIIAVKILYALLFIVLIALILLILLLIIPFPYKLDIINDNNENFSMLLKYLVFKLNINLDFKPKFLFKILFQNKVIVDTSKKKERPKKNSIGDTEFIKNKEINEELEVSKNEIKKLFLSSKKSNLKTEKSINNVSESHENKTRNIIKLNNIVDGFKSVLPKDLIYVIKKILSEAVLVLDRIKPYKTTVFIEQSNSDPYKSGLTMAFAAPLYAFMGNNLHLNVNQKDNDCYKITFYGRPILITLAFPIIRLLLDKKVKSYFFKKS